jgi:hypothetical protein
MREDPVAALPPTSRKPSASTRRTRSSKSTLVMSPRRMRARRRSGFTSRTIRRKYDKVRPRQKCAVARRDAVRAGAPAAIPGHCSGDHVYVWWRAGGERVRVRGRSSRWTMDCGGIRCGRRAELQGLDERYRIWTCWHHGRRVGRAYPAAGGSGGKRAIEMCGAGPFLSNDPAPFAGACAARVRRRTGDLPGVQCAT